MAQPLLAYAPESPAISDRRLLDLRSKVIASLVGSGYVALAYVRCETDQNRVVLFGSVPSYHLKQLAQVHAKRVAGVDHIENRLEVRRQRPL